MRLMILTTIRHDGQTWPAGRKADVPGSLAPGFLEACAARPLTEGEAADEAQTEARIAALTAERDAAIAERDALKAKPKA